MVSGEKALEVIEKLEKVFNQKQKKGLDDIWCEEFQEVLETQFDRAINWWIKHNDRFPTIHQLHQAITAVGGPNTGQKQKYYEWIDLEDMSKRPVLYYFKCLDHIYTCILAKGSGDPDKPPEEFINSKGLRCVREDLFKREYGSWQRIREEHKEQEKQPGPLKEDLETIKEKAKQMLEDYKYKAGGSLSEKISSPNTR